MELRIEIRGNVPKKVRKFVYRHYEKWFQNRAERPTRALRRASVTIDRVGRGHFVHCSILLDTANGTLRSDETGPNLHWAFDECLRQLDRRMSAAARFSGLTFRSTAPATA